MRQIRVTILLLAFLLPSAALASMSEAVREYVLDNGLKVLVVEDHKAPLATFQIWYRVGSKDEPVGKTGMSHLLEHMMFKGTDRFTSKEFTTIVQRNGGTDNAHTTKDYTMYHQSLSSDRIGLSVELESDRMRNLLLESKDVIAERSVVMEERRLRYEDDPQNALYEVLVATALKAHPYRWPIIGWMSDIASVESDDLRAHYRRFYAPDNAFIVVAGDVTPEVIMPGIREAFGKISPSGANIGRRKASEPEQKGQKRVYLKKEAELPFVMAAYQVPSFPHPDSFALDVLSTVLSDGRSSRLYRTLVYEKRQALNAFGDYSGFHRDPFLFILGATAAPGTAAEAVEASLMGELGKISGEAPSEREVQKAKNQIEASFVFAQDSTHSRALYTGLFEMLGGWRLMDTYLEGIRKVTSEDVRAVAGKYLNADKATVAVLIPERRAQ